MPLYATAAFSRVLSVIHRWLRYAVQRTIGQINCPRTVESRHTYYLNLVLHNTEGGLFKIQGSHVSSICLQCMFDRHSKKNQDVIITETEFL